MEFTVAMCALLPLLFSSCVAEKPQKAPVNSEPLLSDLRELAATHDLEFKGVGLDEALPARLKSQIEANPAAAFAVLAPAVKKELQDIRDPQKDLLALDGYVWGLGFTKDPRAVEYLADVLEVYRSENGVNALVRIGNDQAMQLLLRELRQETDQRIKNAIWTKLAEKKYEPVLPATDELFKSEVSGFQLQVIFGLFGDAGVPFLIQKLNAPDRVVRLHAVFLLGLWICPTEAGAPLKERFFKEPDPETREVLVMGLQRVLPLEDLSDFLQVAKQTEKREGVREAIQRAEAMLERLSQKSNADATPMKPDNEAFANAVKEYRTDSLHDVKALREVSTVQNEPELEALREEELRHAPLDDAVVSYGKITEVIVNNRKRAYLAGERQRQ